MRRYGRHNPPVMPLPNFDSFIYARFGYMSTTNSEISSGFAITPYCNMIATLTQPPADTAGSESISISGTDH
jgi:hypothetical protein